MADIKTQEQILETCLGEEVSKHLWNNLKSAYTGSIAAMSEWERQQNHVLRERVEELEKCLEDTISFNPERDSAFTWTVYKKRAKHLLTT